MPARGLGQGVSADALLRLMEHPAEETRKLLKEFTEREHAAILAETVSADARKALEADILAFDARLAQEVETHTATEARLTAWEERLQEEAASNREAAAKVKADAGRILDAQAVVRLQQKEVETNRAEVDRRGAMLDETAADLDARATQLAVLQKDVADREAKLRNRARALIEDIT